MSNSFSCNINLLYFNVRSLLPKIDHLRAICTLYCPDILCIVETWLDDTIVDSEIAIQGYSFCRLDRSRHGGGILIFVKSVFTYSLLFKGCVDFECLVMSVNSDKCNASSPDFTVVLFYRPPNSGHAPLDTLFSTLCNIFLLCSCNLYLIGDFNVNFLSKVSPLYSKLLSVVSSFNLTQIVSEPTRITPHSATLIDLIFVSSVHLVKFCKTISPLANADHCGLQLIFAITLLRKPEKAVPRKVWRYSLADWQKAIELIECIEWDSILSREVDERWNDWKNCFLQVMELCIPHTTAQVRRNLPWLNKGILNAIKKRDTLFRTAKATGKSRDRERYNQKRNQVVSMLRESKQSFFDNNLNQADVKKFWKTVRLLNRNYSSSIPTLCNGAKTADTSLDKATLLNNYFYTCFNHQQPPLQQPPDLAESLLPPADIPSDLLCTEESVLELLSELDTTKSTGHDGISSKMLKCTSSSIADSLHKLFNLSLSTGTFPSDWKLGRITAIPKGTNSELPSGYRPISVLPIVSKLIERHAKTIIMEFLKENSPISTRQWGFMTNRSTISALIKVIDDWSKALDQGYEVCVIFFQSF